MKRKFSQDQLFAILEQTMIYQCACPALVTRLASDLQHLYDYQLACINKAETDIAIHNTIAEATTQAYAAIEDCLSKILELENWDMETLQMPDSLLKQQIDEMENGAIPGACSAPRYAAQRVMAMA